MSTTIKNLLSFLLFLFVSTLSAQVSPTLIIDNVNTQFSNISLPYWLKAGQTVDIGNNAKSVSILEFNVDGTSLEFSQAINLVSSQTVPQNKVWKIEAIGLISSNTSAVGNLSGSFGNNSQSNSSNLPSIYTSPKKFEVPGSYSWQVPPGVTSICVEVWGAGGSGYASSYSNPQVGGGGGGGGGFTYQCLTVVPGTNYTITVGAGGYNGNSSFNYNNLGNTDGGDSIFGTLIATGGKRGLFQNGGQGGIGNYSNGTNGTDGGQAFAGIGGKSGNYINSSVGNGGNGSNQYGGSIGAPGNNGLIIIYW